MMDTCLPHAFLCACKKLYAHARSFGHYACLVDCLLSAHLCSAPPTNQYRHYTSDFSITMSSGMGRGGEKTGGGGHTGKSAIGVVKECCRTPPLSCKPIVHDEYHITIYNRVQPTHTKRMSSDALPSFDCYVTKLLQIRAYFSCIDCCILHNTNAVSCITQSLV